MGKTQIIVEGCQNCPFCQIEYDDYALGPNCRAKCHLQVFLEDTNYFIANFNRDELTDTNLPSTVATPEWCPIAGTWEIRKV
jgi:hypothetical protein